MNLQEIKANMWKFSPIPNIEESNFNKILERFYDMGVRGLVRKNLQNSLDGRLLGFDGPVIVKIQTGTIHKSNIPGMDEVIDRITCLEGRNSYTKETIDHMLNKINQEEVRYISFEDMNTRGLTGARNGQSNSKRDTWGIYAYNKGVHFEEENEEVEVSRGGSHGVGKIASNAASDLHVMYFANCDEHGDKHLGGTVQLIEHEYHGQCYRSTGYFTDIAFDDNNQSKFYPYENHFHSVFEKNSRGLKIVIPYLREIYDDEVEIIRSICDSFFISILQGKLEVHVNEEKITKDTLLNYVKDDKYYEQDISQAKKVFTPLYVDTYLKQEPREIIVQDFFKNEYEFKLYFRYDEEIPKGRVAVVRTVGMKIEDFTVKSNATKPFNAVLIGGLKEDEFLKSLENESHTKLSASHIKDKKLNRNATRFINNLSREIAKVIEEAIRENSVTDGEMDTKDILYVVEAQFKKDLVKSLGTVMVNKGKPVVQVSEDIPVKEKRAKRKNKSDRKVSTEPPKRTRDPLKKQKSEKDTGKMGAVPKTKYSADPNMVERIIVGNKEMLKFDFTKSKEITDETNCDISFAIIDGMGEEDTDAFDIADNYETVTDLHAGKPCSSVKNAIQNVSIKAGTALLQLELNPNFNKSLKFVYYVEV